MKISIVTVCLNSSQMLRSTLASLEKEKQECGNHVEIEQIVIDGGSLDDTVELVKSYPDIRLVTESDKGMYDALAKGLALVSGDIIGYLNAGDIMMPHALSVLSDIFSKNDIDWVTGYSCLINQKCQITAAWKPTRYRREFVLNGFYADRKYPRGIQQESTFWTSKINKKIPFQQLSKFKLAGDYFLWTEFAKHTDLHSIMTLLGGFRIHSGQLSERQGDYWEEAKTVVRMPTIREEMTAYWETKCNPAFRGLLWPFILPQPEARIFEYNHNHQEWSPR